MNFTKLKKLYLLPTYFRTWRYLVVLIVVALFIVLMPVACKASQYTLHISTYPENAGNIEVYVVKIISVPELDKEFVCHDRVTGSNITYDSGTTLIIKAKPNIGYMFSHWEGDFIGRDNEIKLSIDSNKNGIACFSPFNLAIQASGYKGIIVNKLLLKVEQSYPGIKGEYSRPVTETAKCMINNLGIQVIDDNLIESCDATLTFTFTGYKLSARYSVSGFNIFARTLNTGAKVEGRLVLEIIGQEPLSLAVNKTISPPSSITVRKEGATILWPGEAEGEGILDKAWAYALCDGLSRIWGLEALVKNLNLYDCDIHESSSNILVNSGPEAVPYLIKALKDADVILYPFAIRVLVEIGLEARESIPVLIELLNDKTSGAQSDAAWALGQLGDKRAVEPLIQALNDKNRVVRINAAAALGELGDTRAVEPLIQALNDEEVWVIDDIIVALGKLGDTRAVEPLIQVLNSDETPVYVRIKAIEVLGNIGNLRAVEALTQALNDKDYDIRKAVDEALRKISEKNSL